jgi:hypothetical protein
MVLIGLLAFTPSPLEKIEERIVHAQPERIITEEPPIKKEPPKPVVKSFDPKDASTWPKCAANEIVRADNGKCHKKPAERPSVAQVKKKPVSPPAVTGNKYDWLKAAGVPEGDWAAADYIISRESSWNPNALNTSSGACSLAQALPCSKISGDWRDPVTAIKWQYNYVKQRYGGYWGAHKFWVVNHWY